MNMRFSDAPAGKRFVALLAVVSLHLLVLATLRNPPLPNSVQSVPEDKLLVITLLPPESPSVLPLAVIEKRPHALPLLRYSSRKPAAFQNSAPEIDATSHISAPEGKPRVEEAALKESKAKTAETPGYLDNGSLRRDSMGSRSNMGAVDQRWLPREMGTFQQGTAPPDLHVRTSQEVLERTLSRAARGDCRTKHAHMGLLAIPFLLTDTVSDTGCKW